MIDIQLYNWSERKWLRSKRAGMDWSRGTLWDSWGRSRQLTWQQAPVTIEHRTYTHSTGVTKAPFPQQPNSFTLVSLHISFIRRQPVAISTEKHIARSQDDATSHTHTHTHTNTCPVTPQFITWRYLTDVYKTQPATRVVRNGYGFHLEHCQQVPYFS